MGKKSATKRASSSSGEASSPVKTLAVQSEAQKIKEEGNKLFGRKEYQKALEAYDRALKSSDTTSEAPLLHSNKAACYMMLQRMKEAVNECTNALNVDPQYAKALARRSKAYEVMGHYKQALSDAQKANRADSANPDTQESEKRLKDLVSGKSKANGYLSSNGLKKGPAKRGQQQMLIFTVKCSLEGENRVLHILGQATYAELLEQISLKFPAAPPCALKFLDREGDLVTITEKQDVIRALEETVQAAEKAAQASGNVNRGSIQQLLPPVRIQLVPVGQGEVPEPPAEEVRQLEQVKQARRLIQQQALGQQAKKEAEQQQQQTQETYDIDPWLIEFANLFRETLGIEPDRHLDLNNIAWDKLQAAMDSAVLNDKAPELFNQAAERFQEVTAHGYMQWGNVSLCEGKRVIDKAAAEGKSPSEVAEEAEKHFAKAEQKYKECLQTKSNYYDGAASLANLAFERGKLVADFVVEVARPDQPADKQVDAPLPPSKEGTNKTEKELKEEEEAARQAAALAQSQEQLKKALAKLTKENLSKAEPYFKDAWQKFQDAIDMLPEEEKGKPLKPQAQQETSDPQNEEEEQNIWAHCQVAWGNLLYEYSQMEAVVGGDWKKTLDEATHKFRIAGCPEADIRSALGNHTRKDDLDLGPEPEPEKPKENGTVEKPPQSKPEPTKAEDEKDIKGLPSLKPRKSKKPNSDAE